MNTFFSFIANLPLRLRSRRLSLARALTRVARNSLLAATLIPIISGPWLVTNAMAADMNPSSAFDALLSSVNISTTSPGHFQSGARNTFVGGGIGMSIPKSSIQFISVTPMRLNSGCSGVSAMFGGFSFINGQQIVDMLKNIAQGAMGSVFMIAIKTLCPICGAVLEFMKKLSQFAAKMTMDSCRVSEKIAAEIGDKFDSSGEKDKKTCLNIMVAQGETAYDSLEQFCQTAENKGKEINKWLNEAQTPNEKKDRIQSMGIAHKAVNWTWNSLAAMGYTDTDERTFLMNILGTSIVKEDGATPTYVPPAYTPAVAQKLLMCGTNENTPNAPLSQTWCAKEVGSGNYALASSYFTCEDKEDCLNVAQGEKSDAVFGNTGYMQRVEETLNKAILASSTGAAMPEDAIKLMEIAPFPLYKIINIAAIYPGTATGLINAAIVPIAGLLAESHMEKILRGIATSGKGSGGLTKDTADHFRKLLYEMQVDLQTNLEKMNRLGVMQEMLTGQIRQVEQRIQAKVMSKGLMGNQQFSEGVLTAVPATGVSQ